MHNNNIFLYRASIAIFAIIMFVNVLRELSNKHDRGRNIDESIRVDKFGYAIPATNCKHVKNGYMYINANRFRNYHGVIKISAGQNVIITTLPNTGFYTLQLTGNDLTAGTRDPTTLQIIYDYGINKDVWSFSSLIRLELRDVFAVAGAKITATYIAPPGYITYVGINISASISASMRMFA